MGYHILYLILGGELRKRENRKRDKRRREEKKRPPKNILTWKPKFANGGNERAELLAAADFAPVPEPGVAPLSPVNRLCSASVSTRTAVSPGLPGIPSTTALGCWLPASDPRYEPICSTALAMLSRPESGRPRIRIPLPVRLFPVSPTPPPPPPPPTPTTLSLPPASARGFPPAPPSPAPILSRIEWTVDRID